MPKSFSKTYHYQFTVTIPYAYLLNYLPTTKHPKWPCSLLAAALHGAHEWLVTTFHTMTTAVIQPQHRNWKKALSLVSLITSDDQRKHTPTYNTSTTTSWSYNVNSHSPLHCNTVGIVAGHINIIHRDTDNFSYHHVYLSMVMLMQELRQTLPASNHKYHL